jgi:hypothetical protein
LNNAADEWKRPPREWFEAKTQFAIVFGERFVCQYAANVIITGVGYNLRLVLAWLSSLLPFILLGLCRSSPSRLR